MNRYISCFGETLFEKRKTGGSYDHTMSFKRQNLQTDIDSESSLNIETPSEKTLK